jgi:hypothetical protein
MGLHPSIMRLQHVSLCQVVLWQVVAMIHPVIPGASRRTQAGVSTPLARRTLPLPVIPTPPPHRTRNTLYRTAVIDRSGRIRHRILLETLGWTPTIRLTALLQLGQLMLRPDPAGANMITPHGHICLPLDPRRLLGLRPLVADLTEHELAVLPETLLDGLIEGGDLA